MRHHRLVVLPADVEYQPVAGDAEVELERPARVVGRIEMIGFEQIVDRDRALMLDVGAGTADRALVQRHGHEAAGIPGDARPAHHCGLKRIATERAWASSPSASPSAIAAGPNVRNCSGPHLRIDVRFMKSSTPRPDENRAERAVGSTWFEPPT